MWTISLQRCKENNAIAYWEWEVPLKLSLLLPWGQTGVCGVVAWTGFGIGYLDEGPTVKSSFPCRGAAVVLIGMRSHWWGTRVLPLMRHGAMAWQDGGPLPAHMLSKGGVVVVALEAYWNIAFVNTSWDHQIALPCHLEMGSSSEVMKMKSRFYFKLWPIHKGSGRVPAEGLNQSVSTCLLDFIYLFFAPPSWGTWGEESCSTDAGGGYVLIGHSSPPVQSALQWIVWLQTLTTI